MPKVGKKKFPYTTAGKKAAKSYAKKSGKKMSKAPSMKKMERYEAMEQRGYRGRGGR